MAEGDEEEVTEGDEEEVTEGDEEEVDEGDGADTLPQEEEIEEVAEAEGD